MRLIDLFEDAFTPIALRGEVQNALPATYVMPELKNTDSYQQYRYIIALAAAESVTAGDVDMPQESAWNENTAVVCYTPAEQEIVKKANKHMGVSGKLIAGEKSKELASVNTKSPVRPFKDLD